MADDKFSNRKEEYGNRCSQGYSLPLFEQTPCDYSCFPRLNLQAILLDFQKLTGHKRPALRTFPLKTGDTGLTGNDKATLGTDTICGRASGAKASHTLSFPCPAFRVDPGRASSLSEAKSHDLLHFDCVNERVELLIICSDQLFSS